MAYKILQAIFFSLCLIVNAAASNDKAFFWKVESKTATVYMLGSIHFADKSFYPLRKEIEQAFSDSNYLVVELDAESIDPEIYQLQIEKHGSYPEGETIKDHVSNEAYRKLVEYLKKAGVPIKAVEKQKPGMLVLTLSILEVMRLGLDPSMGVDAYFLNRAKMNGPRQKMKILELETLDEQLAIFMNFPDGELLLKETFYSMGDSEGVLDKMISIWKQGDEEKMNALLFGEAVRDYPVFASIYESLFYSRNKKMTNAVKGYLKSQGNYFFVVGAGHLIGNEGIVHLLEESGHKVERL